MGKDLCLRSKLLNMWKIILICCLMGSDVVCNVFLFMFLHCDDF